MIEIDRNIEFPEASPEWLEICDAAMVVWGVQMLLDPERYPFMPDEISLKLITNLEAQGYIDRDGILKLPDYYSSLL